MGTSTDTNSSRSTSALGRGVLARVSGSAGRIVDSPMHIAAAAAIGGGVVGLVTQVVANSGTGMAASVGFVVAGVVIAVAPWPRWPPSATRWVAVAALAAVTLPYLGAEPRPPFGVWIVVVMAWCGLSQPVGWPTRLAPAAWVCFQVPWWTSGSATGGMAAGAVAVVAGAAVGEVIAVILHRQRRVAATETARRETMATLVGATELLAATSDAARTPATIARLGRSVLRGRVAVVAIVDGESLTVVGDDAADDGVAVVVEAVSGVLGEHHRSMWRVPAAGGVAVLDGASGSGPVTVMPLGDANGLLGWLAVGDAAVGLDAFVLDVLELLAGHAALALGRARAMSGPLAHLHPTTLASPASTLLDQVAPGDAVVVVDAADEVAADDLELVVAAQAPGRWARLSPVELVVVAAHVFDGAGEVANDLLDVMEADGLRVDAVRTGVAVVGLDDSWPGALGRARAAAVVAGVVTVEPGALERARRLRVALSPDGEG